MIDNRAECLLARIDGGLAGKRWVDLPILAEQREILELEHIVEQRAHAVLEPRAGKHPINLLRQARAGLQRPALRSLQ